MRQVHRIAERLERIVARYCRVALESEERDAPSAVRSEARQLEDKLLLNPMALKKAYYEIVGDEVAAKREQAPSSARKFKVVDSALAGA